MELTNATRREFLRRVYRAAALRPCTNDEWLDSLADEALKALEAGKIRIGASAGDASSNFLLFSGWTPDSLMQLIDWARDWTGYGSITDALDAVGADHSNQSITEHGFDFSMIRA